MKNQDEYTDETLCVLAETEQAIHAKSNYIKKQEDPELYHSLFTSKENFRIVNAVEGDCQGRQSRH